MAPRHNKHCTFKKTTVCICPNIEAALAEQATTLKEQYREWRFDQHVRAQKDYRDQIIRAFTNLIDANFEISKNCNCETDRWY